MTRYHATPEGLIPFTPEEELEADATQAAIEAASWDFYTKETRNTAYGILEPSDWLVVRQSETGTPAPDGWNEWRESIRVACQTKLTAISECETYAQLYEYVTSSAYLDWPPAPSGEISPE